jgi:branched-chain amino acid aminotransferase
MPASWYSEGAKVMTIPTERFIPTAKSIDYIPAITALQKAKKQNAIEAIYIDRTGIVREGTTSNIFFFQGDTLVTTEENILPGITRQVVLEITRDVFPIEIRPFTVDELEQADAVFITSSTREVVPIVTVNDGQIADGTVQSNVQKIMQLFHDETQRFSQLATAL